VYLAILFGTRTYFADLDRHDWAWVIMAKSILGLVLNGRQREDAVSDNMLLIDYLREVTGLTGTKMGCDGGECGACTVLVDDRPRLSCISLAHSVAGKSVETIEGAVTDGRMSRLQRGFHELLGSQCGYCTPGMIMSSEGLLRSNPDPSDDEIREGLSGNICRCTGYVKIIESVHKAAEDTTKGAKA
jgi:4-hydroxybenzoyl-CoA reductase subunit gamma